MKQSYVLTRVYEPIKKENISRYMWFAAKVALLKGHHVSKQCKSVVIHVHWSNLQNPPFKAYI
ncbi:hypothetical protein HanIR_Chr09g0435161 [Helianthus annuus]|nr:hypothetical protein HanIR_Chr09g0435161 [Helianthus annuus]